MVRFHLENGRMPARRGAVHVATTKRVYKGKTYVTHLLRRSIRKGKTVTHETLGNLSHLPDHVIDLIKRSLKGETFVPAPMPSGSRRSLPHGHVDAVLTMIRKLGVEELIASEAVATARPGDRHDRRTPGLPQLQAGPTPTLA